MVAGLPASLLFPRGLSAARATALQRELAAGVILQPYVGLPDIVAGVDVSCTPWGKMLWGGVVIMERRTRRVLESGVASMPVEFPYIPGLLSFREIPVLLAAAADVTITPDVVLVDGQGLAHPRRLGLACHLGLLWDIPAIGCAKSRLIGETRGEPGTARGCRRMLRDGSDVVGVLLRTRSGVKPMWVSPGHRMDVASARRIVMACGGGYRLPEPTRLAHQLVGAARRAALAQV
jgi:deoxyribonuclease V